MSRTKITKTVFNKGFFNSHRYKTDKGEISLVFPFSGTSNLFEIFCIEGDLFENVERFGELCEAEERINELLL